MGRNYGKGGYGKFEAWGFNHKKQFPSCSLIVPLSQKRTVDANQNHPAERKEILK